MLQWHHIGMAGSGPETVLRYGQMEVARLHQRVDGTWFCTLRMHRPYAERINKDCRSYDSGRAGCEVWARRHEEELRAELERGRREMAERQHWLGNAPSSEQSPE